MFITRRLAQDMHTISFCKQFLLYIIYLPNHPKAYFDKHTSSVAINQVFNQVNVFGRNQAIVTFFSKEIWLTKHNRRNTANGTRH